MFLKCISSLRVKSLVGRKVTLPSHAASLLKEGKVWGQELAQAEGALTVGKEQKEGPRKGVGRPGGQGELCHSLLSAYGLVTHPPPQTKQRRQKENMPLGTEMASTVQIAGSQAVPTPNLALPQDHRTFKQMTLLWMALVPLFSVLLTPSEKEGGGQGVPRRSPSPSLCLHRELFVEMT